MMYTISPTLINEFSWGINRGQQGVGPLTDTSGERPHGGAKTYAQSLLPLKDSQRQRAYAAAHQSEEPTS